MPGARLAFIALWAVLGLPACLFAADPDCYLRKDTWQETLRASCEALSGARKQAEQAGTEKPWSSGVLRGGQDAVNVKVNVAGWKDLYLLVDDDGDYHHDVADWAEAKLVSAEGKEVYLDTLEPAFAAQDWGQLHRDGKTVDNHPLKIGNQPFKRGLGTHANSTIRYALGGKYQQFEAWAGADASHPGSVRFIVSSSGQGSKNKTQSAGLWELLARDFDTPAARQQMAWDREDRIWDKDWADLAELAKRYVEATHGALAAKAVALAASVKDSASLAAVRNVYYASRQTQQAVSLLKGLNLQSLRLAIADLSVTFADSYPHGADYLKRAGELEKAVAELVGPGSKNADLERIAQVQEQSRDLFREALLANPLLDFGDLLVLVRRLGNKARQDMGAELGVGTLNAHTNDSLRRTGWDNEIAILSDLRGKAGLRTLYRPDGGKIITDLRLHFDAQRLMFSSIGSQGNWRVFEINVDGSGLKQLTPDDGPDVGHFDSCYLPDGRIIFDSTAAYLGLPCEFGGRCMACLYHLDPQTGKIRQLTFEQDSDWCPTMLHSGRVLYQRWEYTDLPHSNSRRLFSMNPDGTEQMEYYGSNSYFPNAFFYARAIPGHPTKVVGIAGGHHGIPRSGRMLILDPALSRHESDGVVQEIPGYGKRVEPLIRDNLVDGVWPQVLHPCPLSGKYFLVAMKPSPAALWGIYLVDVFDNVVLLKEIEGAALLEPVALQRTPKPPAIPDRIDLTRKDGVVYLADVYAGPGLRGVPRGTVKSLRVLAYHFSYRGMGGLLGSIGMDGPWDIKRILGTVPVEADGSAAFVVPANTPLMVQPLDAEGQALQLMRSWYTAMPGETVTCTGCHAPHNSAPPNKPGLAFSRPPSQPTPWRGPARGFSFKREVQPVLDKYCVCCHDGQKSATGFQPVAAHGQDARAIMPDLRGTVQITDWDSQISGHVDRQFGGKFSSAYAELHRFVRRPGIESDIHLLAPLEFHAGTTELVQMLKKGHHNVRLDAEAWDRLITWIDLNAPFHGTWSEIVGPQRVEQVNKRCRELARQYANLDEDREAIPPSSGDMTRFPAVRETGIVSPELEEKEKAAVPVCPDWPFSAEEAKRRQTRTGTWERTIELGGSLKLELVLIPAGQFVMGDSQATPEERPLSVVKIDQPFWMGRMEVTNEQYAFFDPAHDSHVESKHGYQFGIHGFPLNEPRQPVVRVTCREAFAFCQWLSSRTGLKFTLPTEAQWEWACRAGSATPFSYGTGDADFSKFANLSDLKIREFVTDPYTLSNALPNPNKYDDWIPKDERFDDGALVSAGVGSYQPNAWGLHDMHGNVAEWTRTEYRPYPYREDDGRNAAPVEPETRNLKPETRVVVRGGSWYDRPYRVTSAFRLGYAPYQPVFNVGFRVICEQK